MKNISEKQAWHKQALEELKKEQKAVIAEMQQQYNHAKRQIDKMKYELNLMKKHRAELRKIKAWMKLQNKSVEEQAGEE